MKWTDDNAGSDMIHISERHPGFVGIRQSETL